MDRSPYKITEASDSVQGQSTNTKQILKNLEDTIALGKAIPVELPNLNLILLEGPLGVGKTSLVQGIAISLNIQEPITSPTFAISQHYQTGIRPLVHIDLYRLEKPTAADELFLQEEEEAEAVGALVVVEWAERMSLKLPDAWRLRLQYREKGGRLFQLSPPEAKKPCTSS